MLTLRIGVVGEAAYTRTGCLQGRVQGTVGEQGGEQVFRRGSALRSSSNSSSSIRSSRTVWPGGGLQGRVGVPVR